MGNNVIIIGVLLGWSSQDWSEPFAKPINFKDDIDGYRFAPPILRAGMHTEADTSRSLPI